MKKSTTGIPGFAFSWRRAIGISKMKQKISRKTGFPMTKNGLERKLGRFVINLIVSNLIRRKL